MDKLFAGVRIRCLEKADYDKTGQKWSVFLAPNTLLKAVARLNDDGWFLEDVCAVDSVEGFLVLYHFDHWQKSGRLSLKVLVPHDDPRVPSISGMYQGALWHERETHDFHGIVFEGHPNLIPLLLPAEADFHPLVKDAKSRLPLKDLMVLGEVVSCEESIQALFPEEAEEAAAEQGGEEAEAEAES
ncbi:MAG: NADH-quinone oxidoreductase subunit C [Desulfovibrionaceae bacterium]|nr:NADH-quinone oxidoreductase subunit C [Desulfovibrionaceae bacterium]